MDVNIDGVTIELDDKDAQILERHLANLGKSARDSAAEITGLKTQVADLQTQVAAKDKTIGTKDGEIAVLKQNVLDAAVTPDKLDGLMADRMDVVDRARAFFGDANYAHAGKTDAQIKREVVARKLGDAAAKAMNDDAIGGAFMSLTAGEQQQDGVTRMAGAFRAQPSGIADRAASAYDQRNADLQKAYLKNRKPFGGTAA